MQLLIGLSAGAVLYAILGLAYLAAVLVGTTLYILIILVRSTEGPPKDSRKKRREYLRRVK